MAIPGIVQVCVAAFILISWSALTALGARYLLGAKRATIELGIGPERLALHLNGFTYRINLVPTFIGAVRVTEGRLRWIALAVPTVTLLVALSTAALLIAAAWIRPHASSGASGTLGVARIVVVESVDSGGAAYNAGLRRGMTIERVDGRPLRDAAELAVARHAREQTIELAVREPGARVVRRVALVMPRDYSFGAGLYVADAPAASARRAWIRDVMELTGAGAGAARRAWLDARTLSRVDRATMDAGARVPLFLLNAAAAMLAFVVLYAVYVTAVAVGGPAAFPLLVAALSAARPGHWPLAVVLLGTHVLLSWQFGRRVSVWVAVMCFWTFHVYALYVGLYAGTAAEFARTRGFPVRWTL